MNRQLPPSEKFGPLLNDACDGTLIETQIQELEAILESDATACKAFADHFQLLTDIRFLGQVERARNVGLAGVRATLPPAAQSSSPVPTLGFLTTTLHGTVGYFSSGWPLAYLVATVILGVALVIGSLVPVSEPVQIARQPVPLPSHLSPLPSIVGRITGTVDCKWEGAEAEDQKSEIRNQKSLVVLGEKFVLASGLMEITYDTGAKVILQGPVTYEVESKNGGYLEVGKLTGKVEGKVAWGFSVRTPTATVTDLGTEFGVEVTGGNAMEVHVLQGSVESKFHDAKGRERQTIRLVAGEARRYRPETGQTVKRGLGEVAVIPIDRAKFEQMRIIKPDERRQRWLAYSRQLRNDPSLVAYYPFESVGRDSWLLTNVAATGEALGGPIEGPLWTAGRFPGKLALRFRGPGTADKVVLPEQKHFRFTGPFSVAVWFKVKQFTSKWQALVTKGQDSWRVQRDRGSNALAFDTTWESDQSEDVCLQKVAGRTAVTDGRWHLAVAVWEPVADGARKRLYLDGRLDGEGRSPAPLRQNGQPVWLGAISTIPGRELDGLIDEVAIFARALSADDVAAMFQAGNPVQMHFKEPTEKNAKM